MKLRLVIEAAPAPQAEMERVYSGGQMSIGRSADVDWQIDDPKMFISRRHCVISEEGGKVVVTDASSGGLFIDNAANPVGLGNVEVIEPGMRLHLGDFTFRVEAASGTATASAAAQEPEQAPPAARSSSFFPAEDETPPPEAAPVRPAALPDPFGLRTDKTEDKSHKEVARAPRPLDQHDPFGLDLRKSVVEESGSDTGSFSGGFFDEPDTEATPEPQATPEVKQPDVKADIFGDWEKAPAPAAVVPEAAKPSPQESSEAPPAAKKAAVKREDEDLRDALLRGMGIDPAQLPAVDAAEEMEQLGKCMRDMVEGLMLLLRTRAQEKQKIRVAQTIIASADVNPLKFLATPEDALSALVRPRGRGYLGPSEAIESAYRDLADHQVRTWSALQIALRRMVDKFDPEEIAREMEDVGLLESLAAGGRNAKLWQIYQDRYRDIAETAEKQFLGDVGADFRDAYENRKRE
ncbi:type VI secretion system-associated FHA domain protein TagH [Lentibacter algarum]|uniref:type VI secretion system-associated FHA domain protein TagH n=1 Tax=Lentibacter algarum TaxID=576131 RepID=UPI001C074263|nr:type VI secretion system-associated FHA domain protein TagH [Lentibacter algarum]MBU2980568.1 type VI secretion system-associated FHA domain protein TagH [Lentibacter algarum]